MSDKNDKSAYFRENGWKWEDKRPKKPCRKVFQYGSIELLCPSITVYRE